MIFASSIMLDLEIYPAACRVSLGALQLQQLQSQGLLEESAESCQSKDAHAHVFSNLHLFVGAPQTTSDEQCNRGCELMSRPFLLSQVCLMSSVSGSTLPYCNV